MLKELKSAVKAAEAAFDEAIDKIKPGSDRYDWYRGFVDSPEILKAYDNYVAKLDELYRARDDKSGMYALWLEMEMQPYVERRNPGKAKAGLPSPAAEAEGRVAAQVLPTINKGD